MLSYRSLFYAATVVVGLTAAGCSKSSVENPVAASEEAIYVANAGDPMHTETSPSAIITATNPASATEVITEFLDLVRRGDADQNSDRLLTTRARQELARIGHRLQPLGSPSARFEVTRAENVPESPGSALVHSFWSEPLETSGDGNQMAQFGEPLQVVWAVQWERSAWRISGLAVQMEAGSQPLVLDFENGDAMAAYLQATSVAKNPEETVSR